MESVPVMVLFLWHDIEAALCEADCFVRFYYLSDSDKRARVIADSAGAGGTADLLYQRYRAAGGSIRDRVAVTDIETQLCEEFLLMTDRFSMAHSLEARTPFLYSQFAALAPSVPPS